MKTSMLRVCSLFAFALMAGGCASIRFTTTLKPQPDPGPIFGEARFCVHAPKVSEKHAVFEYFYGTLPCPVTTAPKLEGDKLRAFIRASVENFPSVFADDIRSIPVAVTINRTHSSDFDCFIYPAIIPSVLGVLPCPEGRTSRYETNVNTPCGGSLAAVSFSRHDAASGTLYTPLGLIPVPGFSDVPRRIGIDSAQFKQNVLMTGERLTYDSLSEAVFQQIRSIPKAEAERLYRERCTRLQTSNVSGRTFWLWPATVDGQLHVCIFTARPTYSNWNPLDDLVVPSNPDGTYPPMLMRKPPYFTEVSVRHENDRIVMGARSVTPSIRQLLALADPDDGGAAALDDDAFVAAMTRALIAAKNTEVPQLAVQAPVAERVAVLNAVEQRLMEAQKYVVGLNSQAEDAVRQGQDAAGFRRKSADVQAYMSVLAEIKNLLMQS